MIELPLPAPQGDKISGIESQYLGLLGLVMTNGQDRENRTGIKTRMTHGVLLRHNMDQGFPLLTTKKINFDSVKAELAWFLSGSTDCALLDELNPRSLNIWKANAQAFQKRKQAWYDDYVSKAYTSFSQEDLEALKEEEWDAWGRDFVSSDTDCGKIYGRSWRQFYGDDDDDSAGSLDQIAFLVNEVKNNPSSRRLMLTNYHPGVHTDDTLCALPPCHVLFQLDIDQHFNKMNASLYMRSADLFLGVPFNIASYALLMEILSYTIFCETGKRYSPGMLVVYMHDAHIYHNHFEQVRTQISRRDSAFSLPKVYVLSKPAMTLDSLSNPKYLMNCINLVGYKHHPFIKAEMAV